MVGKSESSSSATSFDWNEGIAVCDKPFLPRLRAPFDFGAKEGEEHEAEGGLERVE